MTTHRGVALITGASSGIGRSTAQGLAQEGFKVLALARREERLSELASQFKSIIPKKVDLLDSGSLDHFCEEISNLSEPISVLVNNAGFSIRGALEDMPLSSIRRLFEVNLFSLIRLTQACLPGMRRMRKGTIINISSIVGKFTFPLSGVYSSSKHAVEAISDALRLEVRPFGIRVVTIRPGVIATEFNETANRLTGDLLSRTHPDYQPVYKAFGEGMAKLFSNVSIPGPETVSKIILEVVFSDSPQPVYCVGPFTDQILSLRYQKTDEEFDLLMSEISGLKGLKV